MSKTTPVRSGRPWAYLGSLTGGAVSIAANVAHTYMPPVGTPANVAYRPHAFAVVVAVFWPFAVFVAIEILARIDWPKATSSTLLRIGGFVPLAVVAAVVSYRHLSALLKFYGEDKVTYVIGPLAVDGLMVMATGALIATGAHHAAAKAAALVRADVPDTATAASADVSAPVRRSRPARKSAVSKPTGVRSDGAATKAAVSALMSADPQMSTPEMAARLNVSPRTVRRHLSALSASPAEA